MDERVSDMEFFISVPDAIPGFLYQQIDEHPDTPDKSHGQFNRAQFISG